jgi:purine-binding chemotaxis protein CheW
MNLPTTPQHLCTFTVGPYWFGVSVDRVQEVVRSQPITRVPLAPPAVRGLINLRGQIVMAIDLRRCLGLSAADGGADADAEPPPSMNVILRGPDGPTSLLVDSIDDVREADPALFELPPETLRPPTRALIRGVYKFTSRLLIELDADRALAQATVERKRDERTPE